MKTEFTGKEFPLSQKIYANFLRAYPKAHREAYGAAMRQLFRDQCRDAWQESRGWGLVKLWLRVLPDLASTSVMERLAAMNERKTVAGKLASLAAFQAPPGRIFSRVFVTVFLIVFTASVGMTFILPKSYASDSRLLLKYISDEPGSQTKDSHFMQTQLGIIILTQLGIIRSQAVLVPVIERLGLDEEWGKKYFAGEKLSTLETSAVLNSRLSLTPSRDATSIGITVYSDDPREAREIDRAIIDSYRACLLEMSQAHNKKAMDKINAMVETAREQDASMNELKTKVESLRQQYNISKDATGPQSPQEKPYWDAKNTLAGLVQSSKDQWGKVNIETKKVQDEELRAGLQGLFLNIPTIQDPTPGYLVRPNKRLNIILGAFSGIILASMLGGVAAFIAAGIRRRNQNSNAVA